MVWSRDRMAPLYHHSHLHIIRHRHIITYHHRYVGTDIVYCVTITVYGIMRPIQWSDVVLSRFQRVFILPEILNRAIMRRIWGHHMTSSTIPRHAGDISRHGDTQRQPGALAWCAIPQMSRVQGAWLDLSSIYLDNWN